MLLIALVLTALTPLSGITQVQGECRAPLTLMLSARNLWTAWLGDTEFPGHLAGYAENEPYVNPSADLITNATVYVDRGIIVIAVIVQSNNQPGSGFIASVSYNGVKLATTGDTGSRWKVLEGMIYDGAWYDPTYDDSSWASADESALCGVDTAPSTNPDGLSYSSVISNNGMTPGQQTAQYGGDLARWVGISGPESYCSESMSAMYRLVLNLTDLVEEPACYTENDGRSVLGPQTPIMHVPSIGAKSTTSREVSFVGGADGFLDVWMNGIGILRPRYLQLSPPAWQRLNRMDFNVEPATNVLFAFYVGGFGSRRNLIANILYEGQIYSASDRRAPWKFFVGTERAQPPAGWNTDSDFDDSTWKTQSNLYSCAEADEMSLITTHLKNTFGACAKWVWHSPGCVNDRGYTDLYVRVRMDLIDLNSRPELLECSAPPVDPESPKNPAIPTTPTLSDMEIIAITSSATIGSLMLIAAFMFVRLYRARKAKTKTTAHHSIAVLLSGQRVSHVPPLYTSGWALKPLFESGSEISPSGRHPTALTPFSPRPRLMGEIEALPQTFNESRNSAANTVALSMDHGSIPPSELVAVYQKMRLLGPGANKLAQNLGSRTQTTAQTTRTEQTLADNSSHGLEIPGFLQLKEGFDYNVDDEFASGGGGSLYRGQMFSMGLPSLPIIIKKMTKASLPAFRQEVALMWLFNDHENMVKLMGFNEVQLAIVMPEYSMGSLKRLIESCEYDFVLSRSLLLDISRGLCVMHERGVVHQDIKTDNILLEPHPTKGLNAVLTDFGISNVVEDKALTVRAFEVRNVRGLTIRYAAPEAIRRFRSKDSTRVPPNEAKAGDVYSFAIVISELLKTSDF